MERIVRGDPDDSVLEQQLDWFKRQLFGRKSLRSMTLAEATCFSVPSPIAVRNE